MSDKRLRRKNRDNKAPHHVRLYHWMLESPAWKSLMAIDRAIYLEMSARYAGPGSNNGRLPYSVREAAEALQIGTSTVSRSLRRLQERGFIVATQRGTFNRKVRHCTEWRLTEFACDVTQELATKDFMRWSPSEKNTVPPQIRPVSVAAPIGISSGTVQNKNAAYGT